MLGYTERRNLYGSLTVDTSSENLTLGDTLINEADKRIMNSHAWPFLQKDATTTTVASQQFYDLPFNYRKLISKPTVTSGSITYTPAESPNTEAWNRLNSVSNNSDIPQVFFIFNQQIGFYPLPSTSGNTITIPYEIMQQDLSVADFSTGTIVSITNATTTVTGTGTSWTSALAGKFIQISADNTADTGDNEWYEVASVTSTTVLELSDNYNGSSIASATQAYTISQMSRLPDGYDMLPIYKAVETYFVSNGESGKADSYKNQYDELLKQLVSDRGTKLSNIVMRRDGAIGNIKNPNLFVTQ